VFEEEDGDAVVGSPRCEQHFPLVKCRFHDKSSQNDQAGAERQSCQWRGHYEPGRSNLNASRQPKKLQALSWRLFFQRAIAAILAISRPSSGVSFLVRALLPASPLARRADEFRFFRVIVSLSLANRKIYIEFR
jgi:hypothetical protein